MPKLYSAQLVDCRDTYTHCVVPESSVASTDCVPAWLNLLALSTNTQLLLVLLCGINVIEIGSVALQMGTFKLTRHRRRLFRMSPIHHHFEMLGWPESTVIIRFWLIAGVFVVVTLGFFVADFTHLSGG